MVSTNTNVNVIASLNESNANPPSKMKEDIFSASCNITSIRPKVIPGNKVKGTNNALVPNHHNRYVTKFFIILPFIVVWKNFIFLCACNFYWCVTYYVLLTNKGNLNEASLNMISPRNLLHHPNDNFCP